MNLATLAGVAFALFGIFMVRHAMTQYGNAVASRRWPSVAGRLNEIRLWGKRNIGGEMKDAEKLIVEYGYEVNGLRHTGTTVAFHTLVYPETLEFAERHSADRDVEVFYNPGDPAKSVLIPGPHKDKPYSGFILGFLGVAAGVCVAVLGWMGVIG